MSKNTESKLRKIPLLGGLVRFAQNLKIPGLKGLSLYDILELYIIGIVKGALTSRAAGIAFSFLMAFFPFLIFILTLVRYIPIDGFQEDFLYLFGQLLPPTTSDAMHEQVISYITNHNYGGLLSVYFLASILLMTNGINAIFGGFEYSYHVEVTRNIIKQYFIALGVALLLSFYLLLTVLVIFYFELGVEKLKVEGYLKDEVYWIVLGQKVFFVFMVFLSVSTLFHFGTKDSKKHSFISPGSILTTLLILLLTYLFGIYVVKFSNYNELYGSVGTFLVFMLYIWLNSILLLLGFELNASIYKIKKQID